MTPKSSWKPYSLLLAILEALEIIVNLHLNPTPESFNLDPEQSLSLNLKKVKPQSRDPDPESLSLYLEVMKDVSGTRSQSIGPFRLAWLGELSVLGVLQGP